MAAREHGTVRVELGPRSYDIIVGEGLLESAGDYLSRLPVSRRAIVICDETVGKLHLEALARGLGAGGFAHEALMIPAGESSKSFDILKQLTTGLLERGVERGDVVVALGGGVVGDVAGFAAGIVRRGVGYVQVPTTLLAQVDSSVGGKTAINTAQGKNLAGMFHQPLMVLCDADVLKSLPPREIRSGYAEVVKYGLIDDAKMFSWLEESGAGVIAGDAAARLAAVARSCRRKAAAVSADERDGGSRALLNLGHTFGHALEAASGYGGMAHGEAVALGMVLAFDLSVRQGLCPAADAARVREHLRSVGLPVSLGEVPGGAPDAAALLAHMRQDKKVHGGDAVLILARGIGKAFISRDADWESLGMFLDEMKDQKWT